MAVLVIIYYEDMSQGQPTAVVTIPDGMEPDECYRRWLKENGHPEDWEAAWTDCDPENLKNESIQSKSETSGNKD